MIKEKISKRKWGAISLGLGIAMKAGLFVLAIFLDIKDPILASTASTSLIILGGGLLGLDIPRQIAEIKK
jgi:hypothetical protein